MFKMTYNESDYVYYFDDDDRLVRVNKDEIAKQNLSRCKQSLERGKNRMLD